MKKLVVVSALILVSTNGIAQSTMEERYEEKPIRVLKADPFDSDKHVKIRLGDKVTFKIKIYQEEFFGHTTISANADIDNTTAEKVKAVYSISFLNKDGQLVGCYQGSWDLNADEDVNYGSGIVYASPADIASITSYKLRTQVIKAVEENSQTPEPTATSGLVSP